MLTLAVGNGWYRGRLGWDGSRALYGAELGVFAELEVTFEDGAVQRVVTDEQWSAGPSATTANDLYDGQTIDARRRDDAWQHAGPAPAGWVGVHVLEFDRSVLTPHTGPTVSRREELAPRGSGRPRAAGLWSTSVRTSSAGCACGFAGQRAHT